MALVSGTYTTYAGIGLREDLSDIIYNITPTETPFLSAAGRAVATAVNHEWQTDTLAAASATNQQLEGDDASFTTPSATTRVGNYCQISRKTVVVSGTLDAVNKAGRDRELAMQLAKQGAELKRDIEASCIGANNTKVAGAAGTARELGALRNWLTTNASLGASGSTAGQGNTATDGTQRTFTQTMLDAVIASMWDNGGFTSGGEILALCGATQKAALTNFDGVAGTTRHEVSDRKIISTADVYVSQFGDVRIVPERHIRKTSTIDREVYLVNPNYVKVAYLRPFQKKDLATTGDAEKKMLVAEYTLEVCNEAAHGIVADLN